MKLRLSSGNIVFKISRKEAKILAVRKKITEDIFLPDATKISVQIVLSDDTRKIQFTCIKTLMRLILSEILLIKLMESSSKDGITNEYIINNKAICFTLLIDIRRD